MSLFVSVLPFGWALRPPPKAEAEMGGYHPRRMRPVWRRENGAGAWRGALLVRPAVATELPGRRYGMARDY